MMRLMFICLCISVGSIMQVTGSGRAHPVVNRRVITSEFDIIRKRYEEQKKAAEGKRKDAQNAQNAQGAEAVQMTQMGEAPALTPMFERAVLPIDRAPGRGPIPGRGMGRYGVPGKPVTQPSSQEKRDS